MTAALRMGFVLGVLNCGALWIATLGGTPLWITIAAWLGAAMLWIGTAGFLITATDPPQS